MDIWGRRATAVTYFSAAGLATIVCYTADTTATIVVAYGLLMMSQGVWSISATISSELFPTDVRATGNAVANNLIGRLGLILSGVAVGALSQHVFGSVGLTIAVLAIVNFACVLVILLFVPETKSMELEAIAVTDRD